MVAWIASFFGVIGYKMADSFWVGVILFLVGGFIGMLLEDKQTNSANAEHDKRTADKIKESYPKMSDEEALERATKARIRVSKKTREIENDIRLNGELMANVICPHCNKAGEVRMKKVTRITKNRVNSIAGKAIGLGTNSENNVKEMHCKNCDMTWDVA